MRLITAAEICESWLLRNHAEDSRWQGRLLSEEALFIGYGVKRQKPKRRKKRR